jgi:hypothetical protein
MIIHLIPTIIVHIPFLLTFFLSFSFPFILLSLLTLSIFFSTLPLRLGQACTQDLQLPVNAMRHGSDTTALEICFAFGDYAQR